MKNKLGIERLGMLMVTLLQIEQVREELYVLVSVKGLLDPVVLKKSQELDRLINKNMKHQATLS